jgi:carbamoyltransferase
MHFNNTDDEFELINVNKLKSILGVASDTRVNFTNHHFSHVLGSFYFTTWKEKALYITADGGGDGAFYSAYIFDGDTLSNIHKSEDTIQYPQYPQASIGQAYSIVTELLGFTRNKHEGKITGLAAFGKGKFTKQILSVFKVDPDLNISSTLESEKQLKDFLTKIYENTSKEELAASIQQATEILIVKWIREIQKKYDFNYIGMSGGVFSNVKLNQEVAKIENINEVFIFPPMGDDGLSVGNIVDFLIKEHGIKDVIRHRSVMAIPYFGNTYSRVDIVAQVNNFENLKVYKKSDYIKASARLLEDHIGAIFFDGMEMGPRALGARTIMASPKNKDINNSLNQRLDRTEFMPFAPFVRDVDAEDVYEVNDINRYACKFMTITTDVKDKFAKNISAVVHVDNTARPQIIYRDDNYLYYDILTEFYKITGIPTLVNTSFNAHEEPIINTPKEAIEALLGNRIDFLIFEDFIVYKSDRADLEGLIY